MKILGQIADPFYNSLLWDADDSRHDNVCIREEQCKLDRELFSIGTVAMFSYTMAVSTGIMAMPDQYNGSVDWHGGNTNGYGYSGNANWYDGSVIWLGGSDDWPELPRK